MNFYDIVVQQSTVVFHIGVVAPTLRSAKRQAGKIIRMQYPGFHTYRINQHIA